MPPGSKFLGDVPHKRDFLRKFYGKLQKISIFKYFQNKVGEIRGELSIGRQVVLTHLNPPPPSRRNPSHSQSFVATPLALATYAYDSQVFPTYRGCARSAGTARAAQRIIQRRVGRSPGRKRPPKRCTETPTRPHCIPGQLSGTGAGPGAPPWAQASRRRRRCTGSVGPLAGASSRLPQCAEAAIRVDVRLQGGTQRTKITSRADADGVELVGE